MVKVDNNFNSTKEKTDDVRRAIYNEINSASITLLEALERFAEHDIRTNFGLTNDKIDELMTALNENYNTINNICIVIRNTLGDISQNVGIIKTNTETLLKTTQQILAFVNQFQEWFTVQISPLKDEFKKVYDQLTRLDNNITSVDYKVALMGNFLDEIKQSIINLQKAVEDGLIDLTTALEEIKVLIN